MIDLGLAWGVFITLLLLPISISVFRRVFVLLTSSDSPFFDVEVDQMVRKTVLHDQHVNDYWTEHHFIYLQKMSQCHLGTNKKFIVGSPLNG
ncbi:hypothetical protein [Kistimonas asteriae]|uniref:hypothetical protein n=1 Tax=Kistimonas asteriae TaxID=517724 RepID=UPI001BAA7092|nr:hypothetical protein [Kistimonas asteriae]